MHVSSLQIRTGEGVHRGEVCLPAPRARLRGRGGLYFQDYLHCLHVYLALSVRDAWRHSSISKNLRRAVNAPGNDCTSRVIPGEVGLFLPLCHGISALSMVHKATHCKKKAIFTGLVHPAPDAGRRRGPF